MSYLCFLKNNYKYKCVSFTSNLKRRFFERNKGLVNSIKPYIPFELDAYIVDSTKEIAKDLEKYFKTGSGIALKRKRILTYKS